MRLYVGTSGFSYPFWKGPFYPTDLANSEMLAYYASRLDTVEINNTFHRFPRVEDLERWCAQTTPDFRLVLKAPRRISHNKGFADIDRSLGFLETALRPFLPQCGPTLFQFPPWFRRDLDTLQRLIDRLPEGIRAAFEFRHREWLDEEVYRRLREHGIAMVVSDTAKYPAPIIDSAPFGYLRLRQEAYSDEEMQQWADRLHRSGWDEAYLFFKHEDEGAAPRMALRFREVACSSEPSD